jgi:hypothetical protein
VAGCRKHDNEPSGSIKGGEFLDQLIDYQLIKELFMATRMLVSLSQYPPVYT